MDLSVFKASLIYIASPGLRVLHVTVRFCQAGGKEGRKEEREGGREEGREGGREKGGREREREGKGRGRRKRKNSNFYSHEAILFNFLVQFSPLAFLVTISIMNPINLLFITQQMSA